MTCSSASKSESVLFFRIGHRERFEHAIKGQCSLLFTRTPQTLSFLFLSSGVIFQTNNDGSLPPHVLYKIRQNSSFTEKTNEIRRAYWRPGPNTGGKFYFLYGFVWIQGKRTLYVFWIRYRLRVITWKCLTCCVTSVLRFRGSGLVLFGGVCR